MGIEKDILECAKKNICQKDAAKMLNYSSKQLGRICRNCFNHAYKELQYLMVFTGILKKLMNDETTQMIADHFFSGDVPQLYAYVNRFSDKPLKKIRIEGGHRMTKAQKQIMEAQVITSLVNNSGKNITLKQLGVPRCIIVSLRQKKFDIISVPGRYNGGYNLGRTSKSTCLAWINKIRTNRFDLPGNFTF
jgi:hypothetical protein